MTHPGMAFVFVVGVGLATILYYMFADSNNGQEEQQQQQHGPSRGGIQPELLNSWANDRLRSRRRRRESLACTEAATCTICLMDIVERQKVHVHPCRHPFHRSCIEEWRIQQSMEAHNNCPICRMKIECVR